MNLTDRINLIILKINQWLTSPDSSINMAIRRTLQDDFFSESDIHYAISCLKKQISKEILIEWCRNSNLTDASMNSKVLCLHAGNLPLVGFQDALACLLSGTDYYGKISRKDPWLLPDFLNQFNDTGLSNRIHYSIDINEFDSIEADAVIFSGSESSVPEVMRVIHTKKMVTIKARFLIRIAHFSIAYLDKFDDSSAKELVEAILRYDGKGCRSVAIIVSPLPLNSINDILPKYFESYWSDNPATRKPKSKTFYRFAYNKAVEKRMIMMNHIMIEQSEPAFDNDDIIYWVKGGPEKVVELADQYGGQIQCLYATQTGNIFKGYEGKTELLREAQCPSINWKPDGTDILEWLDGI